MPLEACSPTHIRVDGRQPGKYCGEAEGTILYEDPCGEDLSHGLLAPGSYSFSERYAGAQALAFAGASAAILDAGFGAGISGEAFVSAERFRLTDVNAQQDTICYTALTVGAGAAPPPLFRTRRTVLLDDHC